MITKVAFCGHSARLRTSVPFPGFLFAVTPVTTLPRRAFGGDRSPSIFPFQILCLLLPRLFARSVYFAVQILLCASMPLWLKKPRELVHSCLVFLLVRSSPNPRLSLGHPRLSIFELCTLHSQLLT